MAKRYYWLKLKNDFFKSKLMKKLRKISGGDTFTIIYLKMQLLSIQDEGKLFYEGVESSFEEELALELDENVDNVRVTVSFLKSCGLLKQESDEAYLLTEVPFLIGSETASAQRGKEYRANLTDEQKEKERERARIGMAKMRAERKEKENVTACYERVTNVEIEKEIEKEKDIYINNNQYNIKELDKSNSMSDFSSPTKKTTSKKPSDIDKVVESWNELSAKGLNRVTKINPTTNRGKMLKARLKEYSLDDVLKAIDNVKQSDFLLGNNNRGWMITFDWFVKPNNFVKVLEGNYNNTKPSVEVKKPTVTDHKDTKSAAMEIFGEF
jgi:predicted phage replisome organizer